MNGKWVSESSISFWGIVYKISTPTRIGLVRRFVSDNAPQIRVASVKAEGCVSRFVELHCEPCPSAVAGQHGECSCERVRLRSLFSVQILNPLHEPARRAGLTPVEEAHAVQHRHAHRLGVDAST